MRITWGIVLALALTACGTSGDRPDVAKMKPDEACRVIAKRAFECKDTLVKTMSASMKQAGASDDAVARMAAEMSQPIPCAKVDPHELDPVITCYDHDCDKLARCFDAMVMAATRPAGGPAARPVAEPAAVAAPAPGSAATP